MNNLALMVQSPKIDSPFESYGKALSLKNMMSESAMNDLKMKQVNQDFSDEQSLRDLTKQAGGDTTKLRDLVYQSGNYKQGMALDKSLLEQKKGQAEFSKIDLENAAKKADLTARLWTTVNDQASFDVAKQVAQSNGIDVSKLPANYSPQIKSQYMGQALTVKDQLSQALDERKQTEAERNNRAQNSVSRGNLQVARERLDFDRNDPKGQYDAERGLVVNTRTGVAKPVTSADGAPLVGAKSVKLTEDQGKATGWLVQAENAFKNMQAVGVDEKGKPTSATKPGFNDALAAVPSFGATEALANSFRSENRQKFLQSSSSLSESLLRAATGAGVNKDEAVQKIREITPVFGDSDAVIKQKMDSIPLYIESLKVRAGPGASKAMEITKPKITDGDIHSRADAILRGEK